ncbi:hypothetical protein [Streptomyces luteireticuli]|uniref:hypothetical protein n=1 Tax=Streptomyces luteireticuli TaxID=173858 RepID=UPI00355645F6
MSDTIDYLAEVHLLIRARQEMKARQDEFLAGFKDADGVVIPALQDAWAEIRTDCLMDTERHLDALIARLTELFGPPLPGHAFSLTFAGPERYDGEAPYTWVVNGDDLDSARRNLAALPSFREWFEEQASWDEPDEDPDVLFRSETKYSHPGIPDVGCYNDLRREQAAALDTQTARPELTDNARPELGA